MYTSYPWNLVTTANWQKYPSELTPHVTHLDYLSRHIDPSTGVLHTERLLSCHQSIPDILLRLINCDSISYVYETSTVNPSTQTLSMAATNLTFSHLLKVKEECTYTPKNEYTTLFKQNVMIAGCGRWWDFIREKAEEVCQTGFQLNASKGRHALEQALQRIMFINNDADSNKEGD